VTALSNWEGALRRLPSTFDGIACDVLGFGLSSHPDPPPDGMVEFTRLRVETLFAFLDALDLPKVDVVGNSMGAMLALEMAIRRPDRIGRLTLMGSGGIPFEPTPGLAQIATFYERPSAASMARLMTQFLYDPTAFGDLEAIAEHRYQIAARPEVRRSHLATFAKGGHPLPEEQLRALPHEVLLIHGRDDRIIPLQVSLRLLELLEHSSLHVFGKCGHWSQLERPAEFDALVANFHGRAWAVTSK
jgi:2-hydroxymuconate-semialdehyde hydrolase